MRTFSWILIFCWLQQQQQQHLAQARPQANEMHHNTSTITNQTWTTDNHTIDGFEPKNISNTPTSPITSTTTTIGPSQELFQIITLSTRPPAPCCRYGTEAGSRGYICIAYPNFVDIRYHLVHPLKMKFDPRRKKFVQLQLARNIERCAKHNIRKRIYEGCCERAQARMFAEQERKKKLVKDCFDKGGGQKCYNHYG